MESSVASAHDVARELRARVPGIGETALQKLLYYCQGWQLAWFGVPMFSEAIEAWDLGPIVAELSRAEEIGSPVPPAHSLNDSALQTVAYVVSRYGCLSASDLVRLTSAEPPYVAVQTSLDNNSKPLISHAEMAKFFSAENEEARKVFNLLWQDENYRALALGNRDALPSPGEVGSADDAQARVADLLNG